MIYLDNAASTPPYPELIEEFKNWLTEYYPNPDATHEAGYRSLMALQRAERNVLKLIQAESAGIVWTGTATEALNLGIRGYCQNFDDGHVVSTALEHKSVLEPVKQSHLKHKYLPLNDDGIIDIKRAGEVIDSQTRLIAVSHINNETGVIHPIKELVKLKAKLAPKARILVDAAQSFGKIDLSWKSLGIDMMVATAHKINGINGTAALVFDKTVKLREQTLGGGQQNALRSGTLNVPGILAFSKAAEISVKHMNEVNERIVQINRFVRDSLKKIFQDKIIFHAHAHLADPHILSFALTGYQGAILMRYLGAEGVIVGTGSACLAEVNAASHVMTALNVPKHLAFATLRVSFGYQNSMEDAEAFIKILQLAVKEY